MKSNFKIDFSEVGLATFSMTAFPLPSEPGILSEWRPAYKLIT
jgi:hypothetical protein